MRTELRNGFLRVELTPLEQLLGLRRSFAVPVERIRLARVEERRAVENGRGIRAPSRP